MADVLFKAGDVVKLRVRLKESKGGPEMLVLGVGGPPLALQVMCFWFDEHNHGESHAFAASLLELVRSATPPPSTAAKKPPGVTPPNPHGGFDPRKGR